MKEKKHVPLKLILGKTLMNNLTIQMIKKQNKIINTERKEILNNQLIKYKKLPRKKKKELKRLMSNVLFLDLFGESTFLKSSKIKVGNGVARKEILFAQSGKKM